MAFKPVYVVDGARTPFLKARTGPGPFSAGDLAVQAGRALLLRQLHAPTDLDEVIVGCAAPSADEVNIGRVIALRLGCGNKVPGWTVMRNCASGMQALDSAIANIQTGRSQLVLAGGTDALSRAPVLFSDDMVRWLASWYAARGIGARLATLGRLRLRHLAPVIGLLKGLTDPVVGLSMGQTAENVATRFGISRQAMDAYSAQSHARALAGRADGAFADHLERGSAERIAARMAALYGVGADQVLPTRGLTHGLELVWRLTARDGLKVQAPDAEPYTQLAALYARPADGADTAAVIIRALGSPEAVAEMAARVAPALLVVDDHGGGLTGPEPPAVPGHGPPRAFGVGGEVEPHLVVRVDVGGVGGGLHRVHLVLVVALGGLRVGAADAGVDVCPLGTPRAEAAHLGDDRRLRP